MAITTWTLEHPGQLPPNLQSLSSRLESPRVLVCPADIVRSPASDWGTLTATNVSYVYEPSPADEAGLPTAERSAAWCMATGGSSHTGGPPRPPVQPGEAIPCGC
ncbi:MAG: hypothetical protein HS113_12905 [Verrucomicrobiales bacterium]|nr:hypothetical protein [Verrucomicrobiales bacterium]